jgi:Icc-related predicted phosphoesterase
MRIFAISDLHTDFAENWKLVKQISESSYKDDILIVAGDIADQTEIIKRTLALLRSRFKMVFFTPGNHELWVRGEKYDSIEKLSRILRLCDGLDIRYRPSQVSKIWIVPLFSWYDSEFETEESEFETEETDNELAGWADFHFCKWPSEMGKKFEYFLELNLPNIKSYDGPVISFSHFLPRRELLPSRDKLKFKALPKVAGCNLIERQIRELRSVIHVFGHSHINRDCVLDGVRYVQNALSYPRERPAARLELKQILDLG